MLTLSEITVPNLIELKTEQPNLGMRIGNSKTHELVNLN